MKKKIFNLAKLATSRMLYLFLGIGLVFAFYVVKAGWWDDWNATHSIVVSNSTSLTAQMWNGLMGKVNELDRSDDDCLLGFVRHGNMCLSTSYPGSTIFLLGDATLFGTPGAFGTLGSWQIYTIGSLTGSKARIAMILPQCNQRSIKIQSISDAGVGGSYPNDDSLTVCDAGNDENHSGMVQQILLNSSKQFSYFMWNCGTDCGSESVFLTLVGYIEE